MRAIGWHGTTDPDVADPTADGPGPAPGSFVDRAPSITRPRRPVVRNVVLTVLRVALAVAALAVSV